MTSQRATCPDRHGPRPILVAVGYALLLIGGLVAFAWIRSIGEAEFATISKAPGQDSVITAADTKSVGLPHDQNLATVLRALIVIILTARALGWLFHYLAQPRVIGEVVAGIVLGPSFLGRFAPDGVNYLFPAEILPILGALAQLGIILYMFLIGLELNAGLLRSRAHTTVAISHASIVGPFLLGAWLALWLFPRFAPPGVSFTSFSLFMGVAMAITAFPVLARILSDRGMERTDLGVLALSCAAINDATAWWLLAAVIGVAQAQMAHLIRPLVFSAIYLLVLIGIVRPVILRWLSCDNKLTRNATALVLVALLASSLTTELIGLHAIFGAFLLGALIPHDSHLARSFRLKLEDVVTILLLPIFFAYTGVRTQIGLLSNSSDWLFCGAIILVATLGKFGGTYLAARLTGLDSKTSGALGILMNTRGLMELIVLNVGLELGIISPILFAMMVIMALVTTIATTPLLRILNPASETIPSQ